MQSDPLSRTRRARREDLIAAAIRVIARDGVAGASLERIAREAGTSKGTALYHFTGKEEMYGSVIDSLFAAGRAYMTERIVAETTPTAQLEAYLESNLRFIVDNAEHVIAVQRILQSTGLTADDDAVPPLQAMLERGQAAGSFAAFDAEVVALAIRALIEAAALYLPAHPEVDGDHFTAQAVAMMMRSVGVSPT